MDELAAKVADLLKDLPWPDAERVLSLASHLVKVREQPQPTPPEPDEPPPEDPRLPPYRRRIPGTFN